MKRSNVLLAIFATTALGFFGCNSTTTTDGGAGDLTTGSPDLAKATPDMATAAMPDLSMPAATPDMAMAAATLDCMSYCTEVMANCTGANQQYTALANCLGFCATLPKGALGDTSGDTLGCRIYHGGAPAIASPATHCPHAGPTGGDKDPKGATGVCGEPCDAFCDAALAICSAIYPTRAACMMECATFKAQAVDYSIADTATNDIGCRMYHLNAAAASAAAAMTHCSHISAASPVCTM